MEVSEEDLPDLEKKKIKQAVVTDFILSIEIIIIALSAVVDATLTTKILVVSFVALLATVGVYGIVALIVRMDDYGYRLIRLTPEDDNFSDKVGNILVTALPWVIRGLSVVGTLVLLLVSGGIFNHNIEYIHNLLPGLPIIVKEFVLGLVVGLLAVLALNLVKSIFKRS